MADASVAFDWKWGYGDGNLGCWQPEELAEFLLEWCLRKVSLPHEECGGLPAAVQTLLRFLAASNLLDAACAPVAVLEGAIDRLAPGYVAAMGDPSKFGMAKTLVATAAAEGVDLTDPAANRRGRGARSLTEAIPELDVAAQLLAFGVLADISNDVSSALIRQFDSSPTLGGAARCWLVDRGLEPAACLYNPADPAPFIDVLAHRFATRDQTGCPPRWPSSATTTTRPRSWGSCGAPPPQDLARPRSDRQHAQREVRRQSRTQGTFSAPELGSQPPRVLARMS